MFLNNTTQVCEGGREQERRWKERQGTEAGERERERASAGREKVEKGSEREREDREREGAGG